MSEKVKTGNKIILNTLYDEDLNILARCMDERSCLQAIFVINGSNKNEWYSCIEEDVYVEVKEDE